MRILRNISLLLCLLFLANWAFAGETEVKDPENTTKQQGEQNQESENIRISEGFPGSTDGINFQSIDSTEDDSVSKYNFIFYFLYKLKYNDDREIQALF